MNFVLHIDPETGKRTLYPNKTNTPAELIKRGEVVDIDVPTDKPGLMQAFQELFDQIPPESSEKPSEADPAPTPETTESFIFAKEGPLTAKETLQLRLLVDREWDNLPFAWKTDRMCDLMEQVRHLQPRAKDS